MSRPVTDEFETWRPIAGWNGLYEVSDIGRVRRAAPGAGTWVGRIIRSHMSKGYRKVSLRRDGQQIDRPIHSLVAEAFVGPRPVGCEVRHLDGDRLNNQADNLAYGTSSENKWDSGAHGTHANASKVECPRGHLLAEPNLVAAHLARGARDCKACHQAGTAVRNAQLRHGRVLDLDAAAKAAYGRIMGFSSQIGEAA